jgi:hypothetical protein
LEAVKASVVALGLERQRILTDVRKCDIGDAEQVDTLWTRLHVYLYEDNVSHYLRESTSGLAECLGRIEKEVKDGWWRNSDKEAAVRTFSTTLGELESTLANLTSNFYPGGSGMGIRTLMPIFDVVDEVRRNEKPHNNEELGQVALEALSDNSQRDWIQNTGKIETLIAKLQLSFDVKVVKEKGSDA